MLNSNSHSSSGISSYNLRQTLCMNSSVGKRLDVLIVQVLSVAERMSISSIGLKFFILSVSVIKR